MPRLTSSRFFATSGAILGNQETIFTGTPEICRQEMVEVNRRIAVSNQRIAREQELISALSRCGVISLGSRRLLANLQQIKLLHEHLSELLR